MFVLLIVMLILWILFSAGGYALGRAFPKPAVVLAGVVVGLLTVLWWFVLSDDPGDGPGYVVGLGILIWASFFPVLFAVGLASGAWSRPGLTIGVWLGTVVAGLLVTWSPALAAVAPLLLGGFSVAGGMWGGLRMRDDPGQ
jgi:hypothetical protein